jgi:hypothetical protein
VIFLANVSPEEEKRRRGLLNKFINRKAQYHKNYYRQHKAVMDQRAHAAVLSYRKKLIELLGGKCIRCGFSDIRALQIDHISGHGSKELHKKGNITTYRQYLASPGLAKSQLQVLCANCNWIKRAENKEVRRKIANSQEPAH